MIRYDNTLVAVVGAGPAGLMAAYSAASDGAKVVLFDRNTEPGRKLLLTGGGRCNVTHDGEWAELISAFFGGGRFLYPAFRALSNRDTVSWFEFRGISVIRENGGKVFPRSGSASDIRDTLVHACREAGVEVRTGTRIRGIEPGDGRFRLQTGERSGWEAAAVVLATGGLSYPATGSDGDGLRWAVKLGVPVVSTRPALAPLRSAEGWVGRLAGVSVDPVRAMLIRRDAEGKEETAGRAEGALLFTHRGLSGPVVLRLSRDLPGSWSGEITYAVLLDLLPDAGLGDLTAQMEALLRAAPKKTAVNALAGLLPASLTAAVLRQAGVETHTTAGTLSAKRCREAAERCKRLEVRIAGPARYAEAMVTAGGIAQSALDPRTMGVKEHPGLFAAGEIVDIDGDTGGYNLQAAFSTGWVAGCHAAAYVRRK